MTPPTPQQVEEARDIAYAIDRGVMRGRQPTPEESKMARALLALNEENLKLREGLAAQGQLKLLARAAKAFKEHEHDEKRGDSLRALWKALEGVEL